MQCIGGILHEARNRRKALGSPNEKPEQRLATQGDAKVISDTEGSKQNLTDDSSPNNVGTKKRGRPQYIPNERKIAAAKVKASGGSNKDAAAVIYQTHYPTDQQKKNVPAILRHHRETSKRLTTTPKRGNRTSSPKKTKG